MNVKKSEMSRQQLLGYISILERQLVEVKKTEYDLFNKWYNEICSGITINEGEDVEDFVKRVVYITYSEISKEAKK